MSHDSRECNRWVGERARRRRTRVRKSYAPVADTLSASATASAADGGGSPSAATLEVSAVPTAQFMAISVFASEQDITSLRISPSSAKATWTLAPSSGLPAVGTV